jgi:ribose transport system ATP-binding protein
MVEIAKALSVDAKLVILDEPTSSLPLAEADKLLEVIAGLKQDGVSVLFISHRLHEVEQAVDRVVALRDGALAGVLARDEINHDRMVKLMVGRDILVDRTGARPRGAPLLSVRDVVTTAHPAGRASMELHAGEILGLAGLVGAGRTELARVIFGIDTRLGGTIEMGGVPLKLRGTPDAVKRGIYLVPEDRKAAGLILDFSIRENISLPNLGAHASGSIVSGKREEQTAQVQREALRIKTASLATPARSLSGGNQQKVAIAKWLAMAPKVIILDEPTRGIDVGAKAEIYRLMRGLADAGVAILMISSDMEEVLGASDRIAVMHEGTISGVLAREQFSEENILMLAVGGKAREAVTA